MKSTLQFVNPHFLWQMQLEHLQEDGLGVGRLGNAALAEDSSLPGGYGHVDCFDLGYLVEYLARLIP